jgi:L-asparagine oxygenase
MAEHDVPAAVLDAADREALTSAAHALSRCDLVADPERFVLEAQLATASLSAALRERLITFRRFGHPSGGLLIRRVPTGALPPTPVQAAGASAPFAAAALSVLIGVLGEQHGYRPELGGAIVQDIVPVRGFERDQISIGSRIELDSHVEVAFSPLRSDHVALLCLRSDHERRAGTTLSSIDAMLPLLDPAAVDVLRQPCFRTRVDPSFAIGSGLTEEVWIAPIRVFEGPARRPWLRVDFAETQGFDAAARVALDALRAAAAAAETTVRLQAGDLLLIDNKRAVHGRTPFTPRYDNQDRWLLRSFITQDLRRSEDSRPGDGRVIEPDYSGEVSRAAA